MKLRRPDTSLLCDRCGRQLRGYSGSKWFSDMDMAQATAKVLGWKIGKDRWDDMAECDNCYQVLNAIEEQ